MQVLSSLLASKRHVWMPLAFVIFIASVLIIHGFINLPDHWPFADTDEAMRLVQVRDFIAGQSWFDLVPHRLDPSFDVPMHWSRFVDLSMALLYWPLSSIMEAEQAERSMAIIWPPLMLVLCAVPMTMMARRFGGMRAALVTIVLCGGIASLPQFLPGRIDHHSAQMASALFAIVFTMKRRRQGYAAAAGAATAFALSIGIETLPYLVVLACVFATDVLTGRRLASVCAYTCTLALSAIVLFLATVAPRFYAYTACDTLTRNVLAGVIVGSMGLYAASRWAALHRTSLKQRIILCSLAGMAALAATLSVEPRCASGVIATFDPMIRPLWFDHIEEVASAFKLASVRPEYIIAIFVMPIATVLMVATRYQFWFKRDDGRILIACFAMALIVALLQVRGSFYANVFAALLLGPSLFAVIQSQPSLRRFETAPIVAGGMSLALFLGVAWFSANALTEPVVNAGTKGETAWAQSCREQSMLAALAALPKGLVLGPVDVGPYVLLYTHHSVISAPYHRFDRGIVLGQSILYKMDLKDAEAAIRERGIDYVLICPDQMDTNLSAAILDRTPSWLSEISSPDAPVRIFKSLLSPSKTAAR